MIKLKELTKALLDLEKALKNQEVVKKIIITITLENPKPKKKG